MWRFIYRQLTFDPVRIALIVTAVASVVAVILVLEGFNEGLIAQLRQAVMHRQADLIVTQSGVSNMIATRSVLPQFARHDVEAVDGVDIAHPLTGIPVIYSQGTQRTPIFLWVYDDGGGPHDLAVGTTALENRDIVIDRSLAKKHALSIGDRFTVSEFDFRVAGIANDSAAFFTPFGFARYDDLIDFYFESDVAADISTFPLLSFLLVKLSPGAEASSVMNDIEAAVPSVDVFLPRTLAEHDAGLGRVIFGAIMRLLIGVAYLIGLLVTGIVMFSRFGARRADFGVLKALGFSHTFLIMCVVLEALAIVALAIPLGIGLAALIGLWIETIMPLYVILPIEPIPVLRTVLASVAIALAGALIPIHLIRRIEPGQVLGG